jgi:hypothetical protein
MSAGYEAWQGALAAAFFFPHHGPIVLFLDDNETSRIRPAIDHVALDLAEVVRNQLRLGDGRAMFSGVMTNFKQWAGGTRAEPPPVLPVLAVTVLAASRMRSDSDARSTNYYLRLAQILLPESGAEAVENLRNDLREGGAFLDVVQMWLGLHAWIEAQNGIVGTSTIRDHPHLPRIGYPLSQTLVRQSDRMMLTRFFKALDIAPNVVPDMRVILGALDIWTAAAQNRLSDTFMRALSDRETRPLLGAVVEAHAQAWDGRVLTTDGKLRIEIRLGIDLDAWQIRWLFPVPPNGPEVLNLLAPDGGPDVCLTATAGLDYYSVRGSPSVSPELLLTGLRLRGSEFTAEFPASPVLFLRPDPQTGGWSSTPGMLPFEEHLVAISTSYVKDFLQVLSEAASEGWRQVPQRGSVLLSGYALFQKVRFTKKEALELVLSRLPSLRRIGVSPAIIPRARLVRGLPIATSISATHYLVGGAPDLLLPSGPDPRQATVTLYGRSEQLQANGFPLELRRFVDAVGSHVVEADGQELAFTMLEEGPDPAQPAGTATIGWTRDAQLSGLGAALAVVGAVLKDAVGKTPVLGRRGRDESWLLLDGGSVEAVAESPAPHFLSSIDIEIHSPYFEISAPASARWLAQRRGARWHLTEIGPADPNEYNLDIDVLDAWKRACSDANGAQLWKLQLSMSGGAA